MNQTIIDELIKQRNKLAKEVQEKTRALHGLDAAIKLFRADYKPPKPGRGGISRPVLEVLARASEPMTTQEIADALGMPFESVKDALKLQKRRGVVAMEQKGRRGAWRLSTIDDLQ